MSKTTLAEVDAFKRFYFPANDSAYFTLDLKEFDADGQRLNFYYGLNSDTLRVEEPITFNYQIDLGDHYRAGQWLSFYFVADGQKYLLDQVELSGNEKDNVINRSVTFDPGKATEGYVQIEFPQATPFVVNVVPDNATGLAKAASGGALQAFTPKSFRLNQNFPNPFNPTTQIVFDLPQESKVTLEVFDISGHKVATLAKGLKEAGRYHVVFDAHNLASGVYIYRLTTDKGFAQSKKMMLIR